MILHLRKNKHCTTTPEQRRWKKDGVVSITDSSEAEEDVIMCKSNPAAASDDDYMHIDLFHPKQNKDKERKAVAFDPHVVVRLIKGHKELSEQEKNKIWYSPTDLQKIRGETRTTLCLMNTNTTIPSNFEERFCTRGLEGRTRRALRSRTRIREAVWSAVLEEQNFQQVECNHDPIAIAEVATVASRRAIKMAREAAVRDELDAQDWIVKSPSIISMPISDAIMRPMEMCRWPIW